MLLALCARILYTLDSLQALQSIPFDGCSLVEGRTKRIMNGLCEIVVPYVMMESTQKKNVRHSIDPCNAITSTKTHTQSHRHILQDRQDVFTM